MEKVGFSKWIICMDIIELIFGENQLHKLVDSGIAKVIGTQDALFYTDSLHLKSIIECDTEYQYYDIKPTDTVLDIGACIGAFSLKIRNKVNKIYAIEPVMSDYLKKHIALNNANNIILYEYALGEGLIDVSWYGITKQVKGLSLTQLIKLAGGHIDFLKCDCEGGEWTIQKNEIANIRRIEMEVHLDNIHNPEYFDDILTENGFKYTKRYTTGNTILYSAGK